jgi:thiamine kinase
MTAAPASREAAATALAALPGLAGARIVRRLAGGPTNVTWLVEHNATHFVLRLDLPAAAELGLDRESERQVCSAAAAAGLTPAYRIFDPGSPVSLRPFVAGRACTADDLRDRARLEKLAALLRRLHDLPPAGAPFQPAVAASRYAERIGTPESAAIAARAQAAWDATQRQAGPRVPCHNDLVAENVLETTDGELLVIDWEYAGMGDPFFDLAVVVRHHALEESLAGVLLDAYLGYIATRAESRRLQRHCEFYGLLLGLWEQVV